MKCIMKTELAVQLNWRGKGDKHAFEILLTCAVVKCKFIINVSSETKHFFQYPEINYCKKIMEKNHNTVTSSTNEK